MFNYIFQIERFWSRQVSEIKKEGWAAVRRKAKTLTIKLVNIPITLIGLIVAVPVVLIVRLIRPWVLIRFGYFFAGRIGHFAFDVEYYLTEKKLGLHTEKAIDIFFYCGLNRGKPANDFFSKLTRRNLNVYGWVKYLFHVNSFLPGGGINQLLPAVERYGSRDIKGLFRKVGPQLSFTEQENMMGHSFLKSIGMKNSEKFVCLIVRDSAYLNSASYDYHNYRDSDIETYKKAALALAEKGYWVFRMGKVVKKPFKANHPHIIDYANSKFRSDFLDIWLMANCYFTISTSTGLDDISIIFRKPILFVNHLPVGDCRTGSKKYIEHFKIFQWEKNGKYLSLRDQIDCGAIRFFEKSQYDKLGIKIIDNSSSQIKNTVLEFENSLINRYSNSANNGFQDKFWEIMKEWKDYSRYHGKYRAKISNTFLEEHRKWFLA